jgi:dTDP-4-amino-4,6-dideoxygalactose transaminase
MKVPFLDLKAQYLTIKDEIDRAIRDVIDSCAFSGGAFVEQFEKEFADYCGSRQCIAVGSGTEALWLALLARGVGENDEVITVPNTFIATAEAISLCGARPVFVDADERFYTMNPELLGKAITRSTRAIIPVHLYGQPTDMDPVLEIARAHGLTVIEDACQAHGALYKGRRVGSMGGAAAFSFYPGKNLGAYGEAGAIITDEEEFAQKIRMLRDHGQRSKYYHDLIGVNGRMDGIQGAVLSVKLRRLASWNEARIQHAGLYDDLLRDVEGVTIPARAAYSRHIYHIYGVRVPKRDRVLQALKDQGVGCGIHYPVPIHLQKAYGQLGIPGGKFPVSESCAEQMLSLPMYPELTDDQIRYVTEQLQRTLGSLA